MENERKIIKVGSLYMLGTLFSKGLPFLTIPIYTRIMSINDYGIVSTYASWVSMSTILVSMTMYMSVRSSFIDRSEQKKEVLSTIVNFNVMVGCTICFIAGIICNKIDFSISYILIVCCLCQSTYATLQNDYTMFLMMNKDYKKRLFFMIIPELVATVVSIVFVLISSKQEKYYSKIISAVVVYLVFAMIIWRCVNKNITNRFVVSHLKYSLRISIPLVFHGISLYVLNQSDKVMITSLRNATETGIYSLVYNLGMLSTAITYALEGIWIPWYTDKLKTREIEQINCKVDLYAKMIGIFMGILILISPEVLRLMAPKEYWGGKVIVPMIVLSNYVMFLYTFYVNNEHFYKKTKYIAVNSLVGAICNVLLNYLFIPIYGYGAAAVTTLISYIIIMVLHARVSKKLEPELYPIKTFYKSFVYVGVAVLFYYASLDNVVIRWMGCTIYCGCIFLLNRVKIYAFVKKVVRR